MYINEFERLKSKTESYGTKLSTDVLAYRLLKSANLSESYEQLARATISKLAYDEMKSQLKKIFVDCSENSCKQSLGLDNIKTEPKFQSQNDVLYGNFQKSYRNKDRNRNVVNSN